MILIILFYIFDSNLVFPGGWFLEKGNFGFSWTRIEGVLVV